MKIEKVEMITYKVKAKCEKCGEGYMQSRGEALLSYPPQYIHKCNKCGYEAYYREIYPKIIHEEITK